MAPSKGALSCMPGAPPPDSSRVSHTVSPDTPPPARHKPRRSLSFPRGAGRDGRKHICESQPQSGTHATKRVWWPSLREKPLAVLDQSTIQSCRAWILRTVDCCLPKEEFHWTDHLESSSISGVFTLKQEDNRNGKACYAGQIPKLDMISIKSRLGCPHLAPNGPAVWLHIYHVRGSKTIQRLNSVSDLFGLGGIFHSGLELFGFEWAFGSTRASCSGVYCNLPKRSPFHTYFKTIYLGDATVSPSVCFEVLRSLAVQWNGRTYHLLHRNCNHFSLTLAQQLDLGSRFPTWLVKHSSEARYPS